MHDSNSFLCVHHSSVKLVRWFGCPSQIEKAATTPLFKFNFEYIFSGFFYCCFSFLVHVCAWVYLCIVCRCVHEGGCIHVQRAKDTGYISVSFLCILYHIFLYLSASHSQRQGPSDTEARLATIKPCHPVTTLHSFGGYNCNIDKPGFYLDAKDSNSGSHICAIDTNPLSYLLSPDLLSS